MCNLLNKILEYTNLFKNINYEVTCFIIKMIHMKNVRMKNKIQHLDILVLFKGDRKEFCKV